MNSPKELARDRTTEAYALLGVPEDLVFHAPQIASQLGMIAKTLEHKNLPTDPFYYLRASGLSDANKVIDAYFSISKSYARLLPLEAFCVKAGVSPLRVVEIIILTAIRMGTQASAFLAHVSSPDIVQATIEDALNGSDKVRIAAQSMLHKATGFLPTPKGPQTNITLTQNAQTQPVTVIAPSPESTIRRLVDRFNDGGSTKTLPEAQPLSLPTDVEDPIDVLTEEGR